MDTTKTTTNNDKQDARRNMFTSARVLLTLFLGMSNCSVYYGFTVYSDALLHRFYPGQPYNMLNGNIIYLGGFGIFVGTILIPIISPRIITCGLQKSVFVGTTITCIGLILCGISVMYKQLWLLWIGFGFFVGIGAIIPYFSGVHLSVEWFSQIDKQGLGTSVSGFFAGFWASVYCYIVYEFEYFFGGVAASFFASSLMIFLLGGLSALLFPSLWTIPSISNNNDESKLSSSNVLVDLEANKTDSDKSSSTSQTIANKSNNEPRNATKLSTSQLFRMPLFLRLFFGCFLIFLPGFGVKLTIYPLMAVVFDASISTQQTATAVYLFVYASFRLVVGFTIETKISILNWWRITIGTQIIGCVSMGLLTLFPVSSTAFILASALLASSLSATKILFVACIGPLFGSINRSSVFSLIIVTFGCAAMAGPVSIWAAICQFSMVGESYEYNTPVSNDAIESVAIWFFSMAVISVLGGIIILPGYKPIDFSTVDKKFNGSDNTNAQVINR